MSINRVSVPVELRRHRDPLMSLQVTRSGQVAVIAVNGEVDTSNAHLLSGLAERVLRDDPSRLVLDLANVRFFGAAGVRALLRISAAVSAGAGQLLLRNPSQITVTALTATRDIDRFQIHTTTGVSRTRTTRVRCRSAARAAPPSWPPIPWDAQPEGSRLDCELVAGHPGSHVALVATAHGGEEWWWLRWDEQHSDPIQIDPCEAELLQGRYSDDCVLPDGHPGPHSFELLPLQPLPGRRHRVPQRRKP
jgi:anti-anti-sigma factor